MFNMHQSYEPTSSYRMPLCYPELMCPAVSVWVYVILIFCLYIRLFCYFLIFFLCWLKIQPLRHL